MKITKLASKGFSLVEMLVVIAIIGVIAAIAVPQISDFTDAAKLSKHKRNAQNLASVCSAAQAAGLDMVSTDVPTTVTALVAGGTIADAQSAFDGQYFGVPGLRTADQTVAAAFLVFANGTLQYNPTDAAVAAAQALSDF
ncbi:MAG: type IV pilus assembly protein PilA [Verrucomicrobiales bacterium]|jgi:type IV pilus assembly protein PilA